MCFNDNATNDPTQQPIRITQSNEAHDDGSQSPETRSQRYNYKDRAAFVDVTDGQPKKATRTLSNPTMESVPVPKPKRNPNPSWRGRSSNAGTFGMGYGTDFSGSAI